MSNGIDMGDVAGVLAGYKAGLITEQVARKALNDLGYGDGLLNSLLSIGAGIAVGSMVGGVVDSIIDGLFD